MILFVIIIGFIVAVDAFILSLYVKSYRKECEILRSEIKEYDQDVTYMQNRLDVLEDNWIKKGRQDAREQKKTYRHDNVPNTKTNS